MKLYIIRMKSYIIRLPLSVSLSLFAYKKIKIMTAIILTIILSLFSPSAQQLDGTLNKQKCIPAALILGIASLVMSGASTAAGAAKAKAA